MKTICPEKLTSRAKATAFEQSAEHDRCAAALLAKVYETRSITDIGHLHEWAKLTKHTPFVGGVAEGLYRDWLDKTLEQLDRLAAAGELVSKDGKRLDRELPKRRQAAEEEIDSIEKTIAELQEALTDRRAVLSEVNAEAARLNNARTLLESTEDSAERGDMLGQAWTFIRDGKHPFEAE